MIACVCVRVKICGRVDMGMHGGGYSSAADTLKPSTYTICCGCLVSICTLFPPLFLVSHTVFYCLEPYTRIYIHASINA